MKWAPGVIVALLLLEIAPAEGDIVANVRAAVEARDFGLAEREIQNYRTALGVTPEMLEALSWLARGTLATKQYDRADGYATETLKLSTDVLRRTGKGSPPLATALGAAIEVHAQVVAAHGERPEAIAFLRKELADYVGTSLAARIQKNINLLSLEGKPAPAVDVSHWLGSRPRPLSALRGHPVLLFFWAHWCADCKAEVPILGRLMEEFGKKGLLLVGPTQLYGYTAEGEASPDQETRYIDQIRTQYYAPLSAMPVPLSGENFQTYGCSTTPTLVLLDSRGIVRLYHPGAMSFEALQSKVTRLVGSRAASSDPGNRHRSADNP
jgi:thiol-disulfide isomerase/thioredoxin